MPQSFTVEVQPDHLEKLTRARPVPGLAELIWNALDADATKVEVEIERNELGMIAVVVRDNGDGIPHADAEPLFSGILSATPANAQSYALLVGAGAYPALEDSFRLRDPANDVRFRRDAAIWAIAGRRGQRRGRLFGGSARLVAGPDLQPDAGSTERRSARPSVWHRPPTTPTPAASANTCSH